MTARLAIGVGAVLLLVSLFLPWAEAGGAERTGWEFSTTTDVYLLVVGAFGLLAAATGGEWGVFRPDVSLKGTADLLAVIASVLIVWLVAFDFPEGASRELGVWLALIGAATQACGAADWSVLRGAPAFPRLAPQTDRRADR